MIRSRIFIRLYSFCKSSAVLQSICIIAGLLIGSAISCAAGDAHNRVVLSVVSTALSVDSLFRIVLFPVLITMIVHRFFNWWGIIVLSFLKSLFLSLTFGILTVGFASAAWLYVPLVSFTGCITFVLLIWFWRRILRNGYASSKDYFVYFSITIPAWCIDYAFISPFLVSLLKF